MNSMDNFTHKSLITAPYNLTYSYYLSPNFTTQTKSHPTTPILLLHGFPDDAHMWAGAVPTLTSHVYPLLIPDLLGFGASSKPTDPARYNYKAQASSLAQILDAEGITGKCVIPIGHDWGSATAQPSASICTTVRAVSVYASSVQSRIPAAVAQRIQSVD